MKSAANRTPLLILILIGFILSGCAPKLTFYVTRPPRLPIKNVEAVSIGTFEDMPQADIPLPKDVGTMEIERYGAALKPEITEFKANHQAANLVRARFLSGLSESGQYRILNTDAAGEFSGVIPDPDKTAVINARVKFYKFTAEDSEKLFYLLLATRGGLDLAGRLQLMAIKAGVIAAAEADKKGFMVSTPYVETVAAMEIEFDMVRKSDNSRIIEPQKYQAYFTQKWGGDEKTSHLPRPLRQVIVTDYQGEESIMDILGNQANEIQKAISDPEAFLAKGGKLPENPTVPLNTLDVQAQLADEIVAEYLKQISQYTVETTLNVASGDDIAVNYIKGNAYDLAINRLENIDRSEDDSFNLALAYESIAEYNQAAKYYQEALDKDPNNEIYQESLRRVTRR